MAFGTYSSTSAMCQRSPAIRRPASSRLRARIDCKLEVTVINSFCTLFLFSSRRVESGWKWLEMGGKNGKYEAETVSRSGTECRTIKLQL